MVKSQGAGRYCLVYGPAGWIRMGTHVDNQTNIESTTTTTRDAGTTTAQYVSTIMQDVSRIRSIGYWPCVACGYLRSLPHLAPSLSKIRNQINKMMHPLFQNYYCKISTTKDIIKHNWNNRMIQNVQKSITVCFNCTLPWALFFYCDACIMWECLLQCYSFE